MQLINKFDIKKKLSGREAYNLNMVVYNHVKPEEVRVMYIQGKRYKTRQQVPHYDIDKVIAYFEGKIKTGEPRFIKLWKKHLKAVRGMKKIEIKKVKL